MWNLTLNISLHQEHQWDRGFAPALIWTLPKTDCGVERHHLIRLIDAINTKCTKQYLDIVCRLGKQAFDKCILFFFLIRFRYNRNSDKTVRNQPQRFLQR
jgi:hypothetical protein